MAASITYANILKYGTQAAYDALSTKDSAVLYFCTDTKKIYKGAVDFTDSVVFAEAKPTSPIVGKLYILADDGTCQVYNGTSWTVVSYPAVTSISSTSDDVHLPTAKAVYSYVQSITGGSAVVKDVAVSDTEGKIKITKGDDTTSDVAVHGVVTTPTWNSTTRVLTLPIVDGTAVEVNIGKDIFIDPTGNNRYEGGYIYLYLNDGTSTKDPTELKIPVTGLIKDYFGDATNTVSVTVDASTHKVTADVVVRPDDAAASFTNALKVSSATGAKGLYVDLSGVEAEIDELESAVSLGASYNAANSAAASNAMASASTANSYAAANSAAIVAAKSEAKSYADANSAAISTEVATARSTEAVISANASAANSYAAANSAAISTLAVSAASYTKSYGDANSAAASTAQAKAVSAGSYAKSYGDANSTAISTEVATARSTEAVLSTAASTAQAAAESAGSYAKSYGDANSAAASTADAKAVSAGSYAKSYADANSAAASTAQAAAESAGTYAKSYGDANSAAISTEVARATSAEAVLTAAASTADAKAVSAGSYAKSYGDANSAAVSTEVARATSAEAVLTAAASTADAKAVSAGSYAKSYGDANSAAASGAKSYATSYGNANSAAASTAKATADQNTENLSALAVAVGWGTF